MNKNGEMQLQIFLFNFDVLILQNTIADFVILFRMIRMMILGSLPLHPSSVMEMMIKRKEKRKNKDCVSIIVKL